MGKDKLVDLVRKIIEAKGTEEEIDNWMDILEANVPHPEVSDLIFYSKEPLSPEQVVEKALTYKPIQL